MIRGTPLTSWRATRPQNWPGPSRPKLGGSARGNALPAIEWPPSSSAASAALRRLVDQARNAEDGGVRAAAVTGRVMTSLAGDLPGLKRRTALTLATVLVEEHTAVGQLMSGRTSCAWLAFAACCDQSRATPAPIPRPNQ